MLIYLFRLLSRSVARATFGVHFLSSAAVSAGAVFIPLFAARLGASHFEVGVIGAAYGMALLLANVASGVGAERRGRRAFIKLGLAVSAVSCLLQVLARSPAELLAARAVFGFAAGLYPAALTAYAFDESRRVGRFQAWGSLGFGLGALMAGLLGDNERPYLLAAAALFVAFGLSLSFVKPAQPRLVFKVVPRAVIGRNLDVYGALLLRHTGAAAVWVLFPLYLRDLGASDLVIGVLTAINAGTQFFLMHGADRLRPGILVTGGLVCSAATFVAYALVGDWRLMVPIQVVLAASWAGLYVGCVAEIMHRNEERAAAMGLLSSTLAFSNVLGPFLGGAIAEAIGLRGAMWVAAGFSVAALAVYVAGADLRRQATGFGGAPARQ